MNYIYIIEQTCVCGARFRCEDSDNATSARRAEFYGLLAKFVALHQPCLDARNNAAVETAK